MDLQDYQEFTRNSANYNKLFELEYLALGLNGQAGQIASIVQKLAKQDCQYSEKFDSRLKNELGDCLFYMSQLANLLGISFEDLAELSFRKLSINTIQNSIYKQLKQKVESGVDNQNVQNVFFKPEPIADPIQIIITEADRPD